VIDFVNLTLDYPLQIRFIELMPFFGNNWSADKVIKADAMLAIIKKSFKNVIKIEDDKNDTSKKYKIQNAVGTFGFISTLTDQFCSTCNRLRVTADGKIKNCLFGKDELDLLTPLRKGEPLLPIIQAILALKHEKLGGQLNDDFKKIKPEKIINRPMISIGG
jgi:cyclic pyranopterin phosphate synthase